MPYNKRMKNSLNLACSGVEEIVVFPLFRISSEATVISYSSLKLRSLGGTIDEMTFKIFISTGINGSMDKL